MAGELSDRGSAYAQGDKILADAMRIACAGIDVERASEATADLLEFIAANAKRMRTMEMPAEIHKTKECPECGHRISYSVINVEGLTKAQMQAVKSIDELARLTSFTKGQPDSRTEVTGRGLDWLALLTDEQLQQVQGWVKANGACVADSE